MSAVTDVETRQERIGIAWWNRAEAIAGRNIGAGDLLFALHDMFCDDAFESDEEFAFALDLAWSCAAYPAKELDGFYWGQMFCHLGFLSDGVSAPCPERVPTLYRAAIDGDVHGLSSWTDDLKVAEAFLARRPGGEIWVAEDIESSMVRLYSNGRKEREWVIDTEHNEDLLIHPLNRHH